MSPDKVGAVLDVARDELDRQVALMSADFTASLHDAGAAPIDVVAMQRWHRAYLATWRRDVLQGFARWYSSVTATVH